jgi:hypothetical protein
MALLAQFSAAALIDSQLDLAQFDSQFALEEAHWGIVGQCNGRKSDGGLPYDKARQTYHWLMTKHALVKKRLCSGPPHAWPRRAAVIEPRPRQQTPADASGGSHASFTPAAPAAGFAVAVAVAAQQATALLSNALLFLLNSLPRAA